MNSIYLFGPRVFRKISYFLVISREFCDCSFNGDKVDNGFRLIEEPLKRAWRYSDFDPISEEKPSTNVDETRVRGHFSARRVFFDNVKIDARKVLDVLEQDGPGFDTKLALDELYLRLSGLLVREVLLGILRNVNHSNKLRCAKLGYKFFVWSDQQENYRHTLNSYHLIMKIFADCEEFKAMWRLVDDMTENGFPTTARTFNILICTCGGAGLARKVVERFIKSKTFNYRPFKHSYNAILVSLLTVNQYKLIDWVYQHMLRKGDKPLAALNLLNHMKEVGFDPSVLHFTTLIDGLSRAGNLDACNYFFTEMIKNGCTPDVVCYTVMITGYIVAGEFEKAQEMFDGMIIQGHLPNVFTYNSMIRGFCMAGKFEEACSMVKEMESRGCNPNFLVYSTLVSNLRNAGKLSEAHDVIRHMVAKGQYVHLLSKFKKYRRC
ncbi:pentatricopeptide repeat-containing protein At1g55630-like isoform X2 [Juglans microcarpa x Juglans regia]|uniref:pentatricopeptide repeat-containing protein At1g55630-like isoform X2 n=1 Tax=Juglans microcarpa x Juglans regia TaxID=2249226 RepID=UPI001B7E5AA7|nr:pentatricopeptide repeat-containing protein At1g55630-like isoform X2 [Juglans microcarpa x Juglans regia]